MNNYPDACPKFAHCVTPAVWGRREYHFVSKTCLTAKHKSCMSFFGSPLKPECVIEITTPPCSRLPSCLSKLGRERPLDEYAKLVCTTDKYVYCPYYLVWHLNGRNLIDDMTTLEVKLDV